MGSFNLGKSKSSSRGKSTDTVFGGDYYNDMYGQAGQNYQNMMPYANMGFGMTPHMQQQMQQIYGMGQGGAQNQMGGGAYGDTSRYNDMIYDSMANPQQSNTSKMYENIVGGPGNTYADPLIDSMREGMDQNRQMTQGQNDLDAAGMGQGGSSRHAMTNAMADREFNRDAMAMENQIGEQNYERDMGWKMDIANRADSNRQMDLNRAQQMVSGGNESQQYGMNYMPTMQNLSMGYMAPWMQAMQGPWQNMQNYSQNMGDPTVLNESTSRGKGSSYSLGGKGGM